MSSFSSTDMPAIGSSRKTSCGILRERAAELDPLLDAVGEVGDDGVAVARDVQQVDHLLDPLALPLLVADDRRASGSCACSRPILLCR